MQYLVPTLTNQQSYFSYQSFGDMQGLFPYEVFAKLYTYKIEFQPCGLINVGNR